MLSIPVWYKLKVHTHHSPKGTYSGSGKFFAIVYVTRSMQTNLIIHAQLSVLIIQSVESRESQTHFKPFTIPCIPTQIVKK